MEIFNSRIADRLNSNYFPLNESSSLYNNVLFIQ